MTSDYDKSKVSPRDWRIEFETRSVNQTHGLIIYDANNHIILEYRGSHIWHDKDFWSHIVHCVNEHDRLAELARVVEQAAFDEADPAEFNRVVTEAFFEFEPEAERDK